MHFYQATSRRATVTILLKYPLHTTCRMFLCTEQPWRQLPHRTAQGLINAMLNN